ncbi:glycoside hydrolase [Linderina pennispora]|uniref:beta-glucosidase n=1 Tax=Linderina pennispora TaxID=61395 RepID=A0A1Y1WEX9_9FUNG|nr:glycoside hydrolase [Linderina pennispora]ORX71796.1 glycoside hydrolase [Linderina pennispora]
MADYSSVAGDASASVPASGTNTAPATQPDSSPYTSNSADSASAVQTTVTPTGTPVPSGTVAVPSAGYSSSGTDELPASTALPSDKCTWDKVQIPDPVMLNPVKSYSYQPESSVVQAPGKIDKDIIQMVRGLTLEEKIGQMTQIEVGQIIDCNGKLNRTASPGNHDGIYQWYSAEKFAELTDAVQEIATKKGAKIPVIWGLDSVRGANYVKGAVIFPAGIATAATFNPQFAYDAGRVAAKDTRAAGAHWAFAPVLDIGVNKFWSRTYENFGEDPFLSSQMALIRSRVAACMKHFIAYGNPFDGSDRADRHVADHELLEYYVPSFKAAIDAGSATAMESYGAVSGETVMLSNFYLQTLLREHLGFKGFMVTDWGEILSQATIYMTARDPEQAVEGAILRTSTDMSMVADDASFSNITLALSVARILQAKKDLGLFENPYADKELQKTVGSAQDIESGRDTARESITLLKNENSVLPLKTSESVLFLGPTLNSSRYMGGGWNEGDAVYQGFADTVLTGIKQVTGSEPSYMPAVDIDGTTRYDWDGVIAAAKKADKVVIGLGERTYAENFGNIDELTLPQAHIDLVSSSLCWSKDAPVSSAASLMTPNAIVNAYLPGSYGGLPIAEILYGKVNPSGRLPYTYPAHSSQASHTIWQASYVPYKPQWQFGFGLGYSTIKYSNVTVSSTTLEIGSPITVSVSLTNTGTYDQKEPVEVKAGQTKQVELTLKAEDMAFWDRYLRRRIEPSPATVQLEADPQQVLERL